MPSDTFFEQLVGKKIDKKYRLIKLLESRYSRGAVFLGYEELAFKKRGRDLAIKILLPKKGEKFAELYRRLEQEVDEVLKLNKDKVEGVIEIHDCGTGRRWFRRFGYLVMEYYPDYSLDQRLQYLDPPTLGDINHLAQHLSRIIIEIHAHKVFHGDIKPSNIMFLNDMPCLVDFGLAWTLGGVIVPKYSTKLADYIAWEQIHQERRPTREGDIYSFGALIYRMITGDTPYKNTGKGAIELEELRIELLKKFNGYPSDECIKKLETALDQRQIPHDQAEEIVRVLKQALTTDPNIRYKDAKEFYEDFAKSISSLDLKTSDFVKYDDTSSGRIRDAIAKPEQVKQAGGQARILLIIIGILLLIIVVLTSIITKLYQTDTQTPGSPVLTPVAIAKNRINLYDSPLAADGMIRILASGERVELIARSPDGNYFLAQVGEEAVWISASGLQIELAGPVDALPVMPLPTLSPTPTPTITLSAASTSPSPSTPVAIVRDNIPVYENPQASNRVIIAMITSGERVDLVAKSPDENYFQVQVDGRTGWISASGLQLELAGPVNELPVMPLPTLSPTPTPTPTDTPTLTPTPTATFTPTVTPTYTPSTPVAIVKMDIDLYDNPLAEHGVMGTLGSGERVDLVAKSPDDNYFQVQVDGRTGWISASGLQLELAGPVNELPVTSLPTLSPTPTPTFAPSAESTSPSPTPSTPVAIVRDNIPVYENPQASDRVIIAMLTSGERVDLVAKNPDDNYFQVQVDGRTGWISASGLQLELAGPVDELPVTPLPPLSPTPKVPTPTATSTPLTTPVAEILIPEVQVYPEYPDPIESSGATSNTVLLQGTSVPIIGEYEGWYLVYLEGETPNQEWILAHSSNVQVNGPLPDLITLTPTTPAEIEISVAEALKTLSGERDRGNVPFTCAEFNRTITRLTLKVQENTDPNQSIGEQVLNNNYVGNIFNYCKTGDPDTATIKESDWFGLSEFLADVLPDLVDSAD